MRILAFIEEAAVIRKILDHLGLWDVPKRQPKRWREPPVVGAEEPLLVYADSQVIEYLPGNWNCCGEYRERSDTSGIRKRQQL